MLAGCQHRQLKLLRPKAEWRPEHRAALTEQCGEQLCQGWTHRLRTVCCSGYPQATGMFRTAYIYRKLLVDCQRYIH